MPESVLADGLAFIFDLDGVVIDSMPLHTEAWKVYLDRHGISSDEIVELMHGRRNDEIVGKFFGSGLAADEVFRHGAAKEALFRDLMTPYLEQHLVPGVKEFLSKYDLVPTGLASNAEPANIDFVLDRARLRSRFDVIVDGHQVANPKPFPDIYLRAAELLKIAPQNCIVFEDSPTGIEAGLRAGARVVAVQTLTAKLPAVDFLIRDFSDKTLESWLQTLEPRS